MMDCQYFNYKASSFISETFDLHCTYVISNNIVLPPPPPLPLPLNVTEI